MQRVGDIIEEMIDLGYWTPIQYAYTKTRADNLWKAKRNNPEHYQAWLEVEQELESLTDEIKLKGDKLMKHI